MVGPIISIAARLAAKKLAQKAAKRTVQKAAKKTVAKATKKRKSSVDPLTGMTRRQIKDAEDPFAAGARMRKRLKTKKK